MLSALVTMPFAHALEGEGNRFSLQLDKMTAAQEKDALAKMSTPTPRANGVALTSTSAEVAVEAPVVERSAQTKTPPTKSTKTSSAKVTPKPKAAPAPPAVHQAMPDEKTLTVSTGNVLTTVIAEPTIQSLRPAATESQELSGAEAAFTNILATILALLVLVIILLAAVSIRS